MKVNEIFKDGDEIICDLTSFDLWLKLKINYNIRMRIKRKDEFKQVNISL
jgi:hypothetical protein